MAQTAKVGYISKLNFIVIDSYLFRKEKSSLNVKQNVQKTLWRMKQVNPME